MNKRPNILIVMTDHQRGDTALPEHPALTPNLDRFGAEGLTLTNAFCPAPHCCPARATFFTGLYPSRHGVWNNVCNDMALSRGLHPGVRCWSEDLAEAGYRLAFSGKWHVSNEETPADRGWEEYSVTAKKGDHHGAPWSHYEKLATRPEQDIRGEAEILRPGYGTSKLYGGKPGGHDGRVVEEALEALPKLAARDEPWCLFAGFIGPHDPYNVPQKYLEMYDIDDVPLPPSYEDTLDDKPRVYRRMQRQIFGQLSERETREAIRHFWAYCSYLDELFGQLLEGLEATGQAENTLVLYVSDHGDYCGEHGLFAKGIPAFRGAYHVPAIVRWPKGIVDPGRREDRFVSLADFAPTFLEAAGVGTERYEQLTGASLMPFMANETPAEWREDIHTQCNGVELYFTQRSVTTRDYKYVFNGFDDDELYDLQNDPHEMVNLGGDPSMEEVKRDMCRRMWRFACREQDTAISPYITVGLAPYGPGEAFR
ncbi:sulfatase-like hydrolase/transferase [Candidatus Sumerlaeota bacterium]